MVNYIYIICDQIFATSPSFVEEIQKWVDEKEKVHYWPQYAEEFYRPVNKICVQEIPKDDSFKIAFTGNIGTAQGLDILPRTAELLKDIDIKFIIIGDGRYQDEFEQEIKKRDIQDRFIMIPRQPAERIPDILSVCEAVFLSFKNEQLWAMTIPAKLQSYMACGMPIIASAEGESKRIIREAGCGICCEIGSAEQLEKGIRNLMNSNLKKMGENSRLYYETHFDKKVLMNQMDCFI